MRFKVVMVLLAVLLAGLLLPGCSCSSEAADLKIEFNPNPVPSQNDYWRWQVIITEVKGVDVELKSVTMAIYDGDRFLDERSVTDLEKLLPEGRLPAYKSLRFGAGFPCQSITHTIFTVEGIDNNGKEITTEGRVDFVSP